MKKQGKFTAESRFTLPLTSTKDGSSIVLREKRSEFWRTVYLNNSGYSKGDFIWDNHSESNDLDKISQDVLVLPSVYSKSSILSEILEKISKAQFDFFSFRASTMMTRLMQHFIQCFASFNDEEKKLALKILLLLVRDENNVVQLPIDIVPVIINNIAVSPVDVNEIIQKLSPIMPKVNPFKCTCPETVISLVEDDKVLQDILCVTNNILESIPVKRIVNISEFSPSILVEATKRIKNICFNELIQSRILNILEEGPVYVGCAALCNVINECPMISDEIKLHPKIIENILKETKGSCSTMASIALSFINNDKYTLQCLQQCYAKEVNVEIRNIIRKRINQFYES